MSNVFAQWTGTGSLTKQTSTTADVLIGGSSMTGAGDKCFWDYGKKAFRGGAVSGVNWDNDSLGSWSLGFGNNIKATGSMGVSLGNNTVASGNFGATALGYYTIASGNNGVTAAGYYTTASGDEGATALGKSTIASGNSGATALGFLTIASGSSGATALGYLTTASGSGGATALGVNTEANGTSGATAIGRSVTAESFTSITIGSGLVGPPFTKLSNNIAYSLMIGFNSDIPTFFVQQASGAGTTGRVGIATTTPNEKLQINGGINIGNTAANNSGTMRFNGSNFQGYDGATWKNLDDVGASAVWNQSGINANYTSGNVGIGTTGPIEELHVVGATALLRLESTNADSYNYYNSVNGFIGYAGVYSGDYDMDFGTGVGNTTGKTHLVTNSAPRLSIDANGDVGIGTQNPQQLLHVAGDIAVAGQIVHPSDKNLKENIQDITNGLSTINQLSPKSYTHKTNKAKEFGLSTKPQFGLIAQEVEKVLPEIVIQKALVGEDGEIYKGLDYEKLIPILIAALQEVHAQKDELKAEVLNQKSVNRQLFSRLEALETQNTSSK